MSACSAGLLAATVFCSAPFVYSQQPPKSSARDMFFAGLETVSAKKPARPAARTVQTPRPQPVQMQTPFGVRYSVLRYLNQQLVEVSPKTRFRNNDRIQLKVQFNNEGYLYMITQGTSGSWSMLYPKAGAVRGSNHVVPRQDYVIPEKGFMRFSGVPGVEKIFLIVSRIPEQSLEELMFSLQNEPKPPASAPAPAEEPRPQEPRMLMASNIQINNPLVERLRTSYTRDLVLDEPEETPASEGRGADAGVYVVNSSRRDDARIVVDIHLTHQ